MLSGSRQHRLTAVPDSPIGDAERCERQKQSHARSSAGAIDWSILMARAQSGDGEAYRRLLEAIVPYLRSFAARRHRDPRDIEDTVQDVLLTVHAIRHTYDPARPFIPWLVAIAHRRVIDRLRQQGRSRLRDAALRAEHETFCQLQTNIQETRLGRHALREAVESLPPGQRQAVKLLKLQELSLKQASNISGMSVAALKVAMHRALKNLRTMLGKEGDES